MLTITGYVNDEETRSRVYGMAVNALQLIADLAVDEEDRATLLGAAEAFSEIAGPASLRLLDPAHELPLHVLDGQN